MYFSRLSSFNIPFYYLCRGFPDAAVVENPPASAGEAGSVTGGEDPLELSSAQSLSCVQLCEYNSKFGKLSSGYRTGKGQFSFQSLRKAIPKNAQTTAQLHSSHTPVK